MEMIVAFGLIIGMGMGIIRRDGSGMLYVCKKFHSISSMQ